MRWWIEGCPCLVLGLAAALVGGCGAGDRTGCPAGVDRARSSCVEVLVDGRLGASGWFADGEGGVVTAGHAVRHLTNAFEIVWPGHGRYAAELIATDFGNDIALLQARVPEGRTPRLSVAEAAPPAGEPTYFFGSAQFQHGVLICGHVARAEDTFNYYQQFHWPTRCYLVAAPSPPGVSGGPWLDRLGRVAGNQSGCMNQGSSSSGLALVAPPDAIRRLVATRTTVPLATMGSGLEELWTQPVGFIRRFPAGVEGLVTVPVETNGAAVKAGLTRESLIIACGGQPVRYRHEMLRIMQAARPGDTLVLDVRDPGSAGTRAVRVVLQEEPGRGRP